MHKRDLRKQIENLDAAAQYVAKHFPKAWPDGPTAVEEFILDCGRRLMKSTNGTTSIHSGGLHIFFNDDSSFEVLVTPKTEK